MLSLSIALVGVALARTVFVDRENRQLGRRQSWRETLPLTLVAALIAGVIVYEQNLGVAKAAFTGLGVGWTAIFLLDTLGTKVLDALGYKAKVQPVTASDKVPNDMLDALDRIDRNIRTEAKGKADDS